MTLSVASIEPPAVLQTAAVGSVAAAGPVQAPVTVPTTAPPAAPQDGVDRVPHADVVLKDVLVHANQRLTGTLPPLQTPQGQLALAQHRALGTPFVGLTPGLGMPGGEAALPRAASEVSAAGPPAAKAADVPVTGPMAAAAGAPAAAPPAGQQAAQPAAGSPAQAQAQAPAQSPGALHAPGSPAVNPNPPPPPNAAIARQQRRPERWRPRNPRGKDDQEGREPGERGRQG
jgi:hypothetical protein